MTNRPFRPVVGGSSAPSIPFPDLLEILSWARCDRIVDTVGPVIRRHLEMRTVELRAILNETSADHGSTRKVGQAKSALLSLDYDRFIRIISAPELVNHLIVANQGDRNSLAKFLLDSVAAENCRALGLAPASGQWTALGDFGRPLDSSSIIAPLDAGPIVIDAHSPYALRPLQQSAFREVRMGKALPFASYELRRANTRIEAALDALIKVSPATFDFARANLQTIVLRKDHHFVDCFTSSSSRAYIGRAVFVNSHLRDLDLAKLAGALVHESVHAFLYRLEWEIGIFESQVEALNSLVTSAWSGNLLRLNTYVHACFVYFALANFFNLPRVWAEFSPGDVARHRDFAMRGFRDGAYIRPLKRYQNVINPTVLDQLVRLGDIVMRLGDSDRVKRAPVVATDAR